MQRKKWMLTVFVFVGFTIAVYGQSFESKGAYETVGGFVRKGNVVGLSAKGIGIDSIIVQDPISGNVIPTTTPAEPAPTSVNGKKIYKYREVVLSEDAKAATMRMEAAILQRIVDTIKAMHLERNEMHTVKVRLDNIVIDEKGRVVYYRLAYVSGMQTDGSIRVLSRSRFAEKLNSYFSTAPTITPATLNSKKVPHLANIAVDHFEFEIEKPFVTYRKTPSKNLGYELLYGMTK